jgi:hypothetical protein
VPTGHKLVSSLLSAPPGLCVGIELSCYSRYAKDRRKNKGKPVGTPTTAPRNQTFEPDEVSLSAFNLIETRGVVLCWQTAKKVAKAELNLLAQMVGGGGHATSGAEKLNIASLFPESRK